MASNSIFARGAFESGEEEADERKKKLTVPQQQHEQNLKREKLHKDIQDK